MVFWSASNEPFCHCGEGSNAMTVSAHQVTFGYFVFQGFV